MLKLFDPKFGSQEFSDIDLKYIKRFDQYLRVDEEREAHLPPFL